MSTYPKRTMVTLRPEWGPALDKLKREQFYQDTQAAMFRYILRRGLEAHGAQKKGAPRDYPA